MKGEFREIEEKAVNEVYEACHSRPFSEVWERALSHAYNEDPYIYCICNRSRVSISTFELIGGGSMSSGSNLRKKKLSIEILKFSIISTKFQWTTQHQALKLVMTLFQSNGCLNSIQQQFHPPFHQTNKNK